MITKYEIQLEPNRILITLIFILLVGAFVVTWAVDIYVILKILLSLGLVFYGIYSLNRYFFLSSSKSIIKIHWTLREGFSLILSNRVDLLIPASLEMNSIFTSRLIILNFKILEGDKYSTIVFLNRKNHADFRQLIRIGRQ